MRTRIQLDLPDARIRELDELMRACGITTRKDLFNYALTLFEWAIKEREQGRLVGSIAPDRGTFKEVVMPPLQAAKGAR